MLLSIFAVDHDCWNPKIFLLFFKTILEYIVIRHCNLQILWILQILGIQIQLCLKGDLGIGRSKIQNNLQVL